MICKPINTTPLTPRLVIYRVRYRVIRRRKKNVILPKRKSNILEVQTIVLIDVKKTFWGRYLYDQVLSSPSLKTFITLPQLELAIKAHYIEPYHPRWGPFLIYLNEQNTQKRGFVSRDGAPPLVTIKCVAKMNRHHKLIVGVGA